MLKQILKFINMSGDMRVLILLGIILIFILACVLGLCVLRRTLYNMIDSRIERFQSELIEKQVREIQNMYKQVRGWRHDYRNHIQNMKIQLAQGNYAELDSYLDSLADDLTTVDTVIKTGNVMADSILNSKLSVAEKLNIRINVKANIPNNIPLSDVELCAVLGNLLDNAAEGLRKTTRKRPIYAYLYRVSEKSALYVGTEQRRRCEENCRTLPLHKAV